MDNKRLLREILAGLGVLSLGISIYFIFSLVSNLISGQFNTIISSLILIVTFFLIGYLLISIGLNWRTVFKKASRISASLGVLLIIITLILGPVETHSEEVSNSIQPSIDFVVASQISNKIKDSVNIKEGTLTLSMAKTNSKKDIYAKNITVSQADYLLNLLNFQKSYTNKEKKIVGKVITDKIYESLKEKGMGDTPLSASQIKENMPMNASEIESNPLFTPEALKSQEISEKSKLTILEKGDKETIEVSVKNPEKKKVKTVWNKLNLAENVSYSTKSNMTQIIFAIVNMQLDEMNLKQDTIPVSTLNSAMPANIKTITGYDIFSQNITKRTSEVRKLRNDCTENKIKLKELCEPLEKTKYENMIKEAEKGDMNNSIVNLATEELGSKEEIDKYIEEKTNLWKTLLPLAIILLALAGFVYYFHLKANDEEASIIQIPYYISKLNLIYTILAAVLITILYFLVSSNILINTLKKAIPEELGVNATMLTSLPLITVLFEINKAVFSAVIYYLVGSLVVFGLLYMLKSHPLNIPGRKNNEGKTFNQDQKQNQQNQDNNQEQQSYSYTTTSEESNNKEL